MKTAVLILDNIRSVENTGSIFRTAEGLGVKKIILVGTTPAPIDRFGRKRTDFIKVSLGAEELIEWEYVKEIIESIEDLKSQGFSIIALEQSPKSIEINTFNAPDKFALVVGNEVEGVSTQTLEVADTILEISMAGKKESLNVSVACGIALFNLLVK